jgi:hypothetical protein
MCVASSASTAPPSTIEPALSRVNEEITKSGVERPWAPDASGARLVTSKSATSANGSAFLCRIRTSAGFFEPVDGDGFALSLPLSEKLVEQGFVFPVRDSKTTSLFPEKQLLRSSEEGVPEVQLKRAPVGISVGNGVHDGIAGHLVCTVLNEIAQHQGFVVTQMALVEVGLDGAGDFLEAKFAISPLNSFEKPSRSTRHASADHDFLCDRPVIQRIGGTALNDPNRLIIHS